MLVILLVQKYLAHAECKVAYNREYEQDIRTIEVEKSYLPQFWWRLDIAQGVTTRRRLISRIKSIMTYVGL